MGEDEPLSLIVINGRSVDQLRMQLERGPLFCGIPIFPVGCEVQIIPLLRPCRVEPDIEDEP